MSTLSPSQSHPKTHRWLHWPLIILAGAVWGSGAARALAQIAHVTFCHGIPGTLVCASLGAIAVAGIVFTHRTDGDPPDAAVFLPLFLPLLDIVSSRFMPWRGLVLLFGSVVAVVLNVAWVPSWSWLVAAIAVPLLVYLPDLSPYVGRADTFEFQVVGPTLGIAHPSGYPLYTLLCKAFSWLPFGSIAWRVNLTSAVSAAAASGFLYRALAVASGGLLSRRDVPGGVSRAHHAIAFLAAMILAFSPTLWSRAIEAEVYTLNACLVAATLWLVIRWHSEDLSPRRAWPVLGLVIGLALSSHITLGALGLVAASGLLVKRLRPPAPSWGGAVLLGLLGLSLYVYIPLRWPAVTGGAWMSPMAFWRFVTNADSGGALHPLAFIQDTARWALVGRLFLSQVSWGGLALAALGLVSLARQRLALAMGMLLAFGAWTWFNLGFYVADPDYSAFLIPAHVVMIAWLGWGALTIYRLLPVRRRLARSAASCLFLTLVFSQLWQTGPSLDTASQGREDESWARHALAQPLAEGAAILADSEKFPPLYFLQQVEGLRPDLELVTLFNEAQYRADLEARVNAGQSVYLARYMPGMDAFSVSSQGPLVAVGGETVRASPVIDGVVFGDQIVLTGHDLAADPYGRHMHHLTLSWQAIVPNLDDLEIRLRLVEGSEDRVVWTTQGTRPVSGYTTTQAWMPGRAVDDYYALGWPEWLPTGRLELQVALFPRFGVRALTGGDGETWHTLGRVLIPRPSASLLGMDRQDAVFGTPGGSLRYRLPVESPWDSSASRIMPVWLIGKRIPSEALPDGSLTVDLAWQCGAPRGIATGQPWVRWRHQSGTVAPLEEPLRVLGGPAVDAICSAGDELLLRRYEVSVPPETGTYTLEMFWPTAWTVSDSVPRKPARCRWGGARTDACALSDVRVVPGYVGLADFDGRIVLLDAGIDASEVVAGGQLAVDLRWRVRQALDRDYTVFVQVIGPDGKLYGQVDSWPVQGARPTSGWRAGEEVADSYRFYLREGAPNGDHRVIVGWYLLADMTRLPTVAASGQVTGDFVEIGTFFLP